MIEKFSNHCWLCHNCNRYTDTTDPHTGLLNMVALSSAAHAQGLFQSAVIFCLSARVTYTTVQCTAHSPKCAIAVELIIVEVNIWQKQINFWKGQSESYKINLTVVCVCMHAYCKVQALTRGSCFLQFILPQHMCKPTNSSSTDCSFQ